MSGWIWTRPGRSLPTTMWFDQIKKQLVPQIAADSTAGEELLDVFLVAKYLERIGDHATNLAEWVEYALTGTRSKDGHWEAPDGE